MEPDYEKYEKKFKEIMDNCFEIFKQKNMEYKASFFIRQNKLNKGLYEMERKYDRIVANLNSNPPNLSIVSREFDDWIIFALPYYHFFIKN